MRVLVADDDRTSRRMVERCLERWGYDVVSAVDGDSAWRLLNQGEAFHLAVLDWIMPGLSGVDLCRKIRAEERFRGLYLLLLTGRADKRDLAVGLDSGADDYLVKPFDPLELSSRLRAGCRVVESGLLLKEKNRELGRYAKEMEALAQERAQMLVHADRLAALGALTAGVAHEINNPAAFISGNAQTMERCWTLIQQGLSQLREVQSDSREKIDFVLAEFPNMVRGLRQGVRRISEIVDGLKTYARVSKTAREPLSLRECLDQALMLCNNRLKYLARVVKRYDDDLPWVKGDAQKLEQVIVNLLVNAADAIDERVAPDGHGQGELAVTLWRDGEWVAIAVEDNGVGIPENRINDIWRPFYTTKEIGKGTGLGLAISQGIVQDHDGEIIAENRPGGGARFVVRLPAREEVAHER